MKTIDVSKRFPNYSQRNNEIDNANACGPTNFIQGLVYSGWYWDDAVVPQFKQPEDKLTFFCRTNKDVLAYYDKHYHNMYVNWMREAKQKAAILGKEYWEVSCSVNYPPNEVHDVMSYAANLFIGYTADELAKMEQRPVTRFFNKFSERAVLASLIERGLPVVSSVDPFHKGGGHYVTIVGVELEDDFMKDGDLGKVKSYIIDNTYGRFDFERQRYEAVSGNNEVISREKFLDIVKPVSHYFSQGAACCC